MLENHGIPYPYPINRVLDTPIVIVGVKEEVIVEERVKVKVREKVLLKSQEIEKLQIEFGNDYEWAIDELENYKQSSGKQYKSDYHALIGWVKDKYQKEKITQQKPSKTLQNIDITNSLLKKLTHD